MDLAGLNKRNGQAWESAFPELIAPARRRVQMFNEAYCKSALPLDIIEELAVKAVMTAFQSPKEFGDEGHLIGFIVIAARNAARDYRKSAFGRRFIEGMFESLDSPAVEGSHPLNVAIDSPTVDIDQAEFVSIARNLLKGAVTKDYNLLVDKFILEMTEKEIGEKYGWGTSSVHNRIKDACKRIRKVLMSSVMSTTLLTELGFGKYCDE